MKKLALTLTLTLACVAAFAQGKVSFRNDTLHLVYYSTDTTQLLAADSALAGSAVTAGLTLDLWAGTTQGGMASVSTTTLAASPGTFGPVTVNLPFAAGAGQFFEIFAYSTAAGSYAAASAANSGYYFGNTGVFNATSSGTLQPNSLVQSGSPALSTWAAGTQAVSGNVAGSMGGLMVQTNVPEPTSLALLGLGAAGLMIFRRRK